MVISLNASQLKELKKALNNVRLAPKKRQRLLWRLAKYGFIPAVKRYVKAQEKVTGGKFAPRATKRKKSMLSKIPKLIAIKDLPAESAVRLYFKGDYKSTSTKTIKAGAVASVQQNGLTISQSKAQFKNLKNKEGKGQKELNDGPATKRQIKRLRDLNYQKPGTHKVAPKKWLEANLTRKRAGTIISVLNSGVKWFDWGDYPVKKGSWSINVPKRLFFGISDEDFSKSLARELKNIGFGFDVKAQDIKNRGKSL